MLEKTTLLIFSIFLLFISITAVCANDNATFDEFLSADGEMIDDIRSPIDEEKFSSAPGSFNELSELVNGTDTVINLEKDYKYISGDSVSSGGISIDKPMVINGNGHTINASNSVRILFVNSSNIVFNNITFINAYSPNSGGAFAINNFDNITFNDCTFADNYAGGSGAAIFSSATNTNINNCTFKDNYAGNNAGAVYLSGENSNINDSIFESNTGSYGGAVRISGAYCSVNNSSFSSNRARASGGSIYISGSNCIISNSNFTDEYANYGGSMFITGNYPNIINSTFENCESNSFAGAVYLYDGYTANIEDSTFKSNKAGRSAGAIYVDHSYTTIRNSTFEDNYAKGAAGAIGIFYNNVKIIDSTFNSNEAVYHGGAVYVDTYRVTIDNSTFTNNSAPSGGGVYMVYYDSTTTYNSNNNIINSRFYNNTARYGGAAVTATDHATISNSEFINNTAGNYGGAVDLTNSKITDSTLENNSAIFGGALYIHDSDVINSTFTNNHASIGNSIYILNQSNLVDNTVDDGDIFIFNDDNGSVSGTSASSHDIQSLMRTDEGFFAYCAERYNTSPYTGVYDHSMEKLINSINHASVGEYLKILIYQYVDHMDDLRNHNFHDYVWTFTDREYWNSTDPIVKKVIEIYNSGFRVPTENGCKVLANGTLMYFNFSSLITPSGQQNLFLFKFWHGSEINETLDKEVLNKTAIVGDNIEYRIVINNKGSQTVYDNFVEDKDYSNGLVYIDWRPEKGDWYYDNLTGQFRLPILPAHESASIILIFKVLVNGTLYNNATSGVGNVNVTNSSDEIRVYNPNFTVEKISLTPKVELGNQTRFEIVVTNNGDVELTDVNVTELSYEGLIYDHAEEAGEWDETVVNGKHVWKLKHTLPVDEVVRFIVVFNTTDYGNFTNVVVVSSNQTDNKTGNNTTKVLKPGLAVLKNALTPSVIVGNQTRFEIVVINTGEVDLDDVCVIEEKYDGLVYDSAITGDKWIHTMVDGKHAWKLNMVLKPSEEEYFFVIFNTTRVGNFTNFVVASSNKTGNTTGNNTTDVNTTVNETGNNTNFTVQKITIDTEVLLGQLVEFQIIVKNTGDSIIHNLTIHETKYEGLKYHHYVDHFDFWKFNPDEMSWTLKDDFLPGEILGIHVFFNTTAVGRFTNHVVVSSNETENKTGNNTTKVLKPGINIEKIAINKTVVVGQQVLFEIVVRNTGDETLGNVTVREISYDGLVFDHMQDYEDLWIDNGDLSWTLKTELVKGQVESLFLIFNTTKRGNFTNVAAVSSNDTDNHTDKDTVKVLEYDLSVLKNTITKKVVVGEKVEFEIIVTNTGDFDLENVFVRESKYDSGLEYLRYYSVDGDWKFSLDGGKPLFRLNLLKIGESASFRVIFKALSAGNFSNTVEAGFNNTTVANSTNTTEVVDKVENITEGEPTCKNMTFPTPVSEYEFSEVRLKVQIDEEATGNPLIMLLLSLIVIPIRRFVR